MLSPQEKRLLQGSFTAKKPDFYQKEIAICLFG